VASPRCTIPLPRTCRRRALVTIAEADLTARNPLAGWHRAVARVKNSD
jgi:hypothetical protein